MRNAELRRTTVNGRRAITAVASIAAAAGLTLGVAPTAQALPRSCQSLADSIEWDLYQIALAQVALDYTGLQIAVGNYNADMGRYERTHC